MFLALIILVLVLLLIAIRQIGNFRLQIWQIMLGGAVAVLFLGQISLDEAILSINIDVMLFLFGMFIIGQALEESGYLTQLSYLFFSKAKNVRMLILMILFGVGITSALLMNDTLAIIGVPIVLYFSKQHKISPKLLLITLCFAVTIGSAMSPIGNPQNLLIALHSSMESPFITFFSHLFVPTIINLVVAFFILRMFYPTEFHALQLQHKPGILRNAQLAKLCKSSLILLLAMIVTKISLVFFHIELRLTYIALVSALPILLFYPQRFPLLQKIDWRTLVFFAAMFVLMASVWKTQILQNLLSGKDITSVPMVITLSVLLSQIFSNVPLVALYLPLLQQTQMTVATSTTTMLALAAASTIAGNLFILGAASNVIIIQNAEHKGNTTITFWEFARIGIPLTIINALVYWAFLI